MAMAGIRPQAPRWYGVPIRAAAITLLGTLLTFTTTLFFSIVGAFLVALVRGQHPNMPFAYRRIAAPVALVAGCLLLAGSLVYEIRHYRQARLLAQLARAN